MVNWWEGNGVNAPTDTCSGSDTDSRCPGEQFRKPSYRYHNPILLETSRGDQPISAIVAGGGQKGEVQPSAKQCAALYSAVPAGARSRGRNESTRAGVLPAWLLLFFLVGKAGASYLPLLKGPSNFCQKSSRHNNDSPRFCLFLLSTPTIPSKPSPLRSHLLVDRLPIAVSLLPSRSTHDDSDRLHHWTASLDRASQAADPAPRKPRRGDRPHRRPECSPNRASLWASGIAHHLPLGLRGLDLWHYCTETSRFTHPPSLRIIPLIR